MCAGAAHERQTDRPCPRRRAARRGRRSPTSSSGSSTTCSPPTRRACPLHATLPLFIWPAHGLALGVLLVAPARRWPALPRAGRCWPRVAVGLDTARGLAAHRWRASPLNVAQPLFVAAGLQRLAGPRRADRHGEGRVVLPGGHGAARGRDGDPGRRLLVPAQFRRPFREQWSVTFVSTMLGHAAHRAPHARMEPQRARARRSSRRRAGAARARRALRGPRRQRQLRLRHAARTPTGSSRRSPTCARRSSSGRRCASGCAPRRWGSRSSALIVLLAHRPRVRPVLASTACADLRALLHLQGYLATIVVTTLFAARARWWSARRRRARPRPGATATRR